MRLMRHKTADLTLGVYDKTENDELRHELARLPVANALRLAAGAESASVLMHVHPGPEGADRGRCGPLDACRAAGPQTLERRPQLRKLGHQGMQYIEPHHHMPTTRILNEFGFIGGRRRALAEASAGAASYSAVGR